jgi:hypothetical protein
MRVRFYSLALLAISSGLAGNLISLRNNYTSLGPNTDLPQLDRGGYNCVEADMVVGKKIPVKNAGTYELTLISGIGDKLAMRISSLIDLCSLRPSNVVRLDKKLKVKCGHDEKLDLMRVKGIGIKKAALIKKYLSQ